ncbi:MAG: hypothetical protein EOO05_03515 [Chitinophagaceae bacterium]|nr:MAG: hypothetical protein EOO05_03515 [Chitinophagaceae bacterium]
MLKYILLLLTVAFTPGLKAQLTNYNDRGRVRILSSFLVLEIDTSTVVIKGMEQSAVVAGNLLPPAIDLGAALIGEAVKQGAQRYSSTMTATASAAGFWMSDRVVALPVLRIRRMVLRTGKSQLEEAYQLVLHPELSPDKTAFRFVLKDPFEYRYAAVRTRKKYDYINLEVLVRMKALAVTEGEYDLSDLRTSSLLIPVVKTGSTYHPSSNNQPGGWFPFPPRPSYLVETEEASEVLKTVATRGTSNGRPDNDTLTTVTRTINKKGTGIQVVPHFGGNYEITVEVVEINPYRGRAMEREKVYNAGLEPLAELLKEAVKK